MITFYQNLRISMKLTFLGLLLLSMTMVVGVYGGRSLSQNHQLQMRSSDLLERYAQASDATRVAQVDFKKQVQEWKDLLLRSHDTATFATRRASFSAQNDVTDHDLQHVKDLVADLGLSTDSIDTALTTHQNLFTQYQTALQRFDPSDITSAQIVDGLVKGIDRAPTSAIDQIVANVVDHAKTNAQHLNDDGAQAYHTACVWLVIVVLCALLTGVVVTWTLSRSITRPLAQAMVMAQAVAVGDLSHEVAVVSRDETGQLLTALNAMVQQLRVVVNGIRQGAGSISVATQQIATGNLDLSSRTEEQAAALQQTAASMQEFTDTVQRNTAGAHDAQRLAKDASFSAREGGLAMNDAVQAMSSIHNASDRIGDIVEVIEGIAFQTNLLALNAAVEAAHAGDQGRGFAVVAAEVRSLANRSGTAAKDIKNLVNGTVVAIAEGQRSIQRASDTMSGVLQGVTQVMSTVQAMAKASDEQALSIRQVNDAVGQMDQVTQQNAALVEEAAAAADAVQGQAGDLVQSVAFFEVGSSSHA